MSFARQRLPGKWLSGSIIAQAELETWDTSISNALDGAAGGTWAPSSAITIGGLGINITGPAGFQGTSTFNGQANFNGFLVANGNIVLGNASGDSLAVNATTVFAHTVEIDETLHVVQNATFDAQITITGALIANGNIVLGNSVGDSLAVNATTVFANDVEIDGDIVLGDDPSTASILTVNTDTVLKGILTIQDAAHVRFRSVMGVDADANYGVDTVDEVYIDSLSPARTWSLINTGAGTGSRIRFINFTAVDLIINFNGGSLMVIKNATGYSPNVEFTYIGGTWRRSILNLN